MYAALHAWNRCNEKLARLHGQRKDAMFDTQHDTRSRECECEELLGRAGSFVSRKKEPQGFKQIENQKSSVNDVEFREYDLGMPIVLLRARKNVE